ncbi:hypothetical protein [Rugamonas rivuli]|uniref:Ankyrin repeat domain-containing protein n=1 Tax=Rugamonas rivuli TaxID=2743358 RepID=A0A843SIG4_9BURK|nr:hypothetical protein [Rugamonas rivuli]MQA21870.1 hypothetical protein [Rugamonas rivuli]
MDKIWGGKVADIEVAFNANNVDTPNMYGVRPLQVACLRSYPCVDVVACLLGMGASVDFEVQPGITLLQALARSANQNPHMGPVLSLLEKAALKGTLTKELPVNPDVTVHEREVTDGDRPVFRTKSGKTKA